MRLYAVVFWDTSSASEESSGFISKPLFRDQFYLVCKRHSFSLGASFFLPFRPFPVSVWLYLAIIVVSFGFVVDIINYGCSRDCFTTFRCGARVITLVYKACISFIKNKGQGTEAVTLGKKILFCSFAFYSLFVFVIYESALTAVFVDDVAAPS